MMNTEFSRLPLFVHGDFDGFIGLFIDNLVNLLIITSLCLSIKMPSELVFGQILPATAISVCVGNIFFSWLGRRLAISQGRTDVTALPYGINTVSLLAFFSMIILPVYISTKDPLLAWKVGVASCLISGICETLGAFVGQWLRRVTPRAALLATLAGVALSFIALDHTVKIWDKPLIAFIPLALILAQYFSGIKLPFRIPAGLYGLIAGGIIAWATSSMDPAALRSSFSQIGLHVPGIAIFKIFEADTFSRIAPFLSVSVPMGIMSFLGSIQNIESAAAAGDDFPTKPVLLMDGVGSIAAAVFGSPFPTSVYIGHPGWKALGARAGYSAINGAVITIICFSGLMSVIASIIPFEAGYPILMWIGIVMTAQAFQAPPAKHAPAVALGLMPSIASWGTGMLSQYISAASPGTTQTQIYSLIAQKLPEMKAIIPFSQGSLFSSMFLTAVGVSLIDKNFRSAFVWTAVLAVCSWFGITHSGSLGWGMGGCIPAGYALMSALFILIYIYRKISDKKEISA